MRLTPEQITRIQRAVHERATTGVTVHLYGTCFAKTARTPMLLQQILNEKAVVS
jgi:hypothetical protein